MKVPCQIVWHEPKEDIPNSSKRLNPGTNLLQVDISGFCCPIEGAANIFAGDVAFFRRHYNIADRFANRDRPAVHHGFNTSFYEPRRDVASGSVEFGVTSDVTNLQATS